MPNQTTNQRSMLRASRGSAAEVPPTAALEDEDEDEDEDDLASGVSAATALAFGSDLTSSSCAEDWARTLDGVACIGVVGTERG